MAPNEDILKKERAKCHSGPGLVRVGGIYQDKYKSINGFLVLTTRKLMFKYEQGIFSKKKGTLLEVPLGVIHNVFITRSLLKKRLVAEYKSSGKLQQSSFQVQNPNAWAIAIRQVVQRLAVSQEAKRKKN